MRLVGLFCFFVVSTHSRLKAAGVVCTYKHKPKQVSTHSRLKAAGENLRFDVVPAEVSTHSRLKAAGKEERVPRLLKLFQHTAA